MKTFARLGWFLIALGAAGLLSSCASNRASTTTQRVTAGSDFEVVETSAKRQLTAAEMEQLHVAVAQFLEKQGAVASGDYYVKVYLTSEQGGVPSDWVVVRFTRDTDLRFTLLGSYPAYSYGYRSYAAYDYYPYGYGSFGRISFHYYDDPFYGSRYYFPRRSNQVHSNRHDGNRGEVPAQDRTPGSGHQGPDYRTADNLAPGAPPAPATRARRNGNATEHHTQPREQDYPSRNRAPHRQPESVQASGNSSSPAGVTTPRRERPAPAAYSPPASNPAPRNLAPGNPPTQTTRARADSNSSARNTQPREQNYPSRNQSPHPRPERAEASGDNSTPSRAVSPRSERPAPASYSPPASRQEPRENSSGDRSPKESHRASPDNTRFEN